MQTSKALSRVCSLWVALCMSFLFCLVLQTTAFAQSDNAQISGFIKDPTGAAVPGASVVIKNEVSNYERTAKTNDTGYYIITDPGNSRALAPEQRTGTREHQCTLRALRFT